MRTAQELEVELAWWVPGTMEDTMVLDHYCPGDKTCESPAHRGPFIEIGHE